MAFGVPAGANKAYQGLAYKPGIDSESVGNCGAKF